MRYLSNIWCYWTSHNTIHWWTATTTRFCNKKKNLCHMVLNKTQLVCWMLLKGTLKNLRMKFSKKLQSVTSIREKLDAIKHNIAWSKLWQSFSGSQKMKSKQTTISPTLEVNIINFVVCRLILNGIYTHWDFEQSTLKCMYTWIKKNKAKLYKVFGLELCNCD